MTTPCYAGPDYVNARDFGVTGDGSLQTAAWLAAWDASRNRRLVLPAGKIFVDACEAMDPNANYFVVGQGAGTGMDAGTCVTNVGTTHGIVCNDAAGVGRDHFRWFRDWRFEGNQFSQDGFQFAGAFAFRMSNMWVSGHGGHGIYGYKAYSSIIRDTVVTHNGKNGVYFLDEANNVTLDNVKVFNSSRNGDGHANIWIGAEGENTANLQLSIRGCDWSSSGTNKWGGGVDGGAYGLILQYCHAASIQGNYAETAPNLITYVASNCRGVDFRGNRMQDGHTVIEEGARGVVTGANVFAQQALATSFRAASSPAKSAAYNCFFLPPELVGGALNVVL